MDTADADEFDTLALLLLVAGTFTVLPTGVVAMVDEAIVVSADWLAAFWAGSLSGWFEFVPTFSWVPRNADEPLPFSLDSDEAGSFGTSAFRSEFSTGRLISCGGIYFVGFCWILPVLRDINPCNGEVHALSFR